METSWAYAAYHTVVARWLHSGFPVEAVALRSNLSFPIGAAARWRAGVPSTGVAAHFQSVVPNGCIVAAWGAEDAFNDSAGSIGNPPKVMTDPEGLTSIVELRQGEPARKALLSLLRSEIMETTPPWDLPGTEPPTFALPKEVRASKWAWVGGGRGAGCTGEWEVLLDAALGVRSEPTVAVGPPTCATVMEPPALCKLPPATCREPLEAMDPPVCNAPLVTNEPHATGAWGYTIVD